MTEMEKRRKRFDRVNMLLRSPFISKAEIHYLTDQDVDVIFELNRNYFQHQLTYENKFEQFVKKLQYHEIIQKNETVSDADEELIRKAAHLIDIKYLK